jgi:hypothetical protein
MSQSHLMLILQAISLALTLMLLILSMQRGKPS